MQRPCSDHYQPRKSLGNGHESVFVGAEGGHSQANEASLISVDDSELIAIKLNNIVA